jgi:hypothetical protein
LGGRHLGWRGKRGSEGLGGRLELDGCFWKCHRRSRAGTGWAKGARRCRTGKPNRRRWSHGGGGTCGTERNGGCRCWRTRRSTRRTGWRSRNRRPHRRSDGHGGRWNGRRCIGGFQGDADGFLFERNTRRLLGRGWW